MYKRNYNSTSITRLADGASIPADPANTDYAKYLADVAADPTCVADADQPLAPDPCTTPPALVASVFDVLVANGDVQSISAAFNLVAAIYLDVGQYMLLFLTPQTDVGFYAVVNGGAPYMCVIEKTTDYITVQALDAINGLPVDPAQFSVQVFRVGA